MMFQLVFRREEQRKTTAIKEYEKRRDWGGHGLFTWVKVWGAGRS